MNKTEIFRTLHTTAGKPLILANIWDVCGARLIESLGAKAIATTSAGVAWANGYPDGNSMPPTLQARLANEIIQAVKIPVSIDFEAGYSDDPKTVAENLRPLIDANISGINLEDGTDAPELLARKIEAIKGMVASTGSDIFVNARTDVFLQKLVGEPDMVRETLARAAMYRSAGADGLFVPAVTRPEDIESIVSESGLPLNVLFVPGLPNIAELAKLGVGRLSAGSSIAQVAQQEFARLAQNFLTEGSLGQLGEQTMPYSLLQSIFASQG